MFNGDDDGDGSNNSDGDGTSNGDGDDNSDPWIGGVRYM